MPATRHHEGWEAEMTKPIRGEGGRFAGSVGSGKHDVPTAASTTRPSSGSEDLAAAYEARATTRAAVAGRHLLFGASVRDVRAGLRPDLPAVAVTFLYPRDTDAGALVERLDAAGIEHSPGAAYGRVEDRRGWTLSAEPTGEFEVSSPLLDNTEEGWAQARAVERALRGPWWRRGPAPRVVAEAGALPVPRFRGQRVLETRSTFSGPTMLLTETGDADIPYAVYDVRGGADSLGIRFTTLDQAREHLDLIDRG